MAASVTFRSIPVGCQCSARPAAWALSGGMADDSALKDERVQLLGTVPEHVQADRTDRWRLTKRQVTGLAEFWHPTGSGVCESMSAERLAREVFDDALLLECGSGCAV
jgi:hypothetical protein